MKKEDLANAVGEIRDEYLTEAGQARQEKKKKKRAVWIRVAAMAACICIAVGVVWRLIPTKAMAYEIASAKYPTCTPFPNEADYKDWKAFDEAVEAWKRERIAAWQMKPATDGMNEYFEKSIRQFLGGSEGENRVFSPVNLYMALAMLAESTDGSTRGELLDLLGETEITALRDRASDVWNALYVDDGAMTRLLANSVWLNEGMTYHADTLDLLANRYYASSFHGVMGSDDYNDVLRDWLNEQTGGLLRDEANGMGFSDNTVLALASSIYFKARWANEFIPSYTAPAVFHGPDGDVTTDFMNKTAFAPCYFGKHYTATVEYFSNNGGQMWLILPDEDATVDDVLADEEFYEMLFGEWPCETMTVELSVPKFDVSSSANLVDGLRALGVQDVFEAGRADFSPMLDGEAYVSEVNHAARVLIDEEGCTAAAFTLIAAEGTSEMTADPIRLNFDRPFLFVVTSEQSLPLFCGIVQMPD